MVTSNYFINNVRVFFLCGYRWWCCYYYLLLILLLLCLSGAPSRIFPANGIYTCFHLFFSVLFLYYHFFVVLVAVVYRMVPFVITKADIFLRHHKMCNDISVNIYMRIFTVAALMQNQSATI